MSVGRGRAKYLKGIVSGPTTWAHVHLAASAFAYAPVALLVVGPDGIVADANGHAAELLGYEPAALTGLPVEALLPAAVRARHAAHRAAFAQAPAPRRMADGFDLEVLRADGTRVAVDIALGPMGDGCVCVAMSDATDHRRSERHLKRLANTDPLTGLLNRRGFEEALHERFADGRREGDRFALVIVDVDRFKAINDSAGHLVGDALLTAIADAMARRLRAHDLLARMGGDEFMVLFDGAGGDEAATVAEDLRAAIARLTVPAPDGAQVGTTVSIGLAAFPEDGDDPRAMATLADERLYAVKARGRDAVGR
jgi:diguanylate cyclase (GGDEF)-like protein/PAS domain S-box-containing protein